MHNMQYLNILSRKKIQDLPLDTINFVGGYQVHQKGQQMVSYIDSGIFFRLFPNLINRRHGKAKDHASHSMNPAAFIHILSLMYAQA